MTRPGANETVALPSPATALPPLSGVTSPGGERPLPGVAAGSVGSESAPCGVVSSVPFVAIELPSDPFAPVVVGASPAAPEPLDAVAVDGVSPVTDVDGAESGATTVGWSGVVTCAGSTVGAPVAPSSPADGVTETSPPSVGASIDGGAGIPVPTSTVSVSVPDVTGPTGGASTCGGSDDEIVSSSVVAGGSSATLWSARPWTRAGAVVGAGAAGVVSVAPDGVSVLGVGVGVAAAGAAGAAGGVSNVDGMPTVSCTTGTFANRSTGVFVREMPDVPDAEREYVSVMTGTVREPGRDACAGPFVFAAAGRAAAG